MASYHCILSQTITIAHWDLWTGHSAALLGAEWYIAGGGDNKAGCTDVWSLDVGGAQQTDGSLGFSWREVDRVAPGSSIVSEGMDMVGIERERLLLTFGGYNGRYQNTVHAFRKGANPISFASSL